MAEAHITWKVQTLRAIINGPPNFRFYPKPNTEEAAWFMGMIKDGYVDGRWGREVNLEDMTPGRIPLGPMTGPEVYCELHVTEKGKKLVYDFDCRRQAAEDFKKLDPKELLKWDDKQLAEWQSRFKSNEAQWVLAEQEWKRRAGISTRRIAIFAIGVSVISLIIAALAYFHPLNGSTLAPVKQSVPPMKTGQ